MQKPTLSLSAIAAALATALLVQAPAHAAKPAKAPAYITVNGVTISKNLADAFVAEQKAQGVADSKELQDAVKEQLIRLEVMAQEAKKKGLDKKVEIASQMEIQRQMVLVRALIQDYVKSNPVTDEAMHQEYDRIKSEMTGKEFKARHILVEKEDEAKAIIDKLGKGEKFEELAKASKDQGSKDKGGELGWSAPNAFVKPFGDALATLEKGKYTAAPVKSEFGYHVIQLDDSRPIEPPPFDQVKAQLQQHIQQQRVEKLITDLRAKAKVE